MLRVTAVKVDVHVVAAPIFPGLNGSVADGEGLSQGLWGMPLSGMVFRTGVFSGELCRKGVGNDWCGAGVERRQHA